MSKKMCKITDTENAKKVRYPKHECKICGSVAEKEKHLCKPIKK